DDAAGQDHLALGPDDQSLIAFEIFDPGGALAFEENARRQRSGLDHEVWPPQGRPQISVGGAAAASVADRLLRAAEAFLLLAVVIVGQRMTSRFAGRAIGLD